VALPIRSCQKRTKSAVFQVMPSKNFPLQVPLKGDSLRPEFVCRDVMLPLLSASSLRGQGDSRDLSAHLSVLCQTQT